MKDSALSLFELNNLIKGVLKNTLSNTYWIRAEMSDVRVNQNGHCYLEFIEKDKSGRTVVAKSRAMIWASTFYMLRAYFEETTQQPFASGLKVLVEVSVEFHELYGMSLTVQNIDPSYTLGDQALNRSQIIKQLEEDGVLELNKELDLPIPCQRIAIISSPTAAGYEDFCNQLENNASQYIFYTKLFPAIMQGDRAEDSIISALEQIYTHQDAFDAVVIIRGGGATSDLSCFDSYLLAASCAQFPLPIITGIGHERDQTVLDIVAHTRAKTPTAVAEFLINNMDEEAALLENTHHSLIVTTNEYLNFENNILLNSKTKIDYLLRNWTRKQEADLERTASLLKRNVVLQIKNTESRLEMFEKSINLISPQNVLKRGYSITLKNGKSVKKASDVKKGDQITTILSDGELKSITR